jgi:hypothetical protein
VVLFAVALVLVLAAVPLTGGRLGALAELRLRAPGLAVGAIVLQVLVISVLTGAPEWLGRAGHLASYALLAGFAWANRRVPGVALMAAGGALNVLAISVNGGVMPAAPGALAAAGIPVTDGFANAAALAHPHLLVLGDVFAVPAGVPVSGTFSVGDVLLVAGAAWGVLRICRRPAAPSKAA